MGTWWTDTSYYDSYYNYSYPYPFVNFRVADGTFADPKFVENYNLAKAHASMVGIFGYYVFRPSVSPSEQLDMIKSQVGTPDPRFCPVIDIETWGNQITSNYSGVINELRDSLADWLGNANRVVSYGNYYNLQQIYPNRPSQNLIIASYGSIMPSVSGQIGWQYYGGPGNSYPAGYPISTAPFGACDHNYSPLSAANLAIKLGIKAVTPVTPPVVSTVEDEDMYIKFVNSGPHNNDSAVYLVSGGVLTYIDANTYGWLGKPTVHAMDLRSTFWKLNVAPGSPDYRGK